jgi:hypothetical protein
MSRLRAPSAACADARADARRRSRSESVETGCCDRTRSTRAAGSQCGQPTSPRFIRTCRRCAPARAGEGKSSLAAHPHKKRSAPGCWSPRRVAPAAERCSNAVLECPVYRRFAVTGQLQNVADPIPAMCSSSGSSDDLQGALAAELSDPPRKRLTLRRQRRAMTTITMRQTDGAFLVGAADGGADRAYHSRSPPGVTGKAAARDLV